MTELALAAAEMDAALMLLIALASEISAAEEIDCSIERATATERAADCAD